MSVKDAIKKSVLESGVFSELPLSELIWPLLAALLLGCLIYLIYRRFYTGVVYSRSFAVTLVGMCVLTCMVTLAISTSIVISLGMVGALSIVRYRTAIKDPMDLLYLFWSITTGITTGAKLYDLALLAALVMIVLIALFFYRQESGKIYVVVLHYQSASVGDQIIRAFGRMKYNVKSTTVRGQETEMAVEVFCGKKGAGAYGKAMRHSRRKGCNDDSV